MHTEKQIEASRLNGATVTNNAPVRPYPRDFQTQGSLSGQEKRQLLANSVAFPTEDSDEFLELLDDYRHALNPVGFLEERVVETISVCDWYRRRYWVLGMAKVGHATALQEKSADDFTNEMHNDIAAVQTALAVSKLADTGRTLEYFRRCDTGYSREYLRARKELKELQTDRAKREETERLSRPPDFDVESCFVHTDDLAEEARKYAERRDPGVPFRGAGTEIPFTGFSCDVPSEKYSEQTEPATVIQSWEPYSPENAVQPEAPGHADADSDVDAQAQHTVESELQPEPATAAAEKIALRSEPTGVGTTCVHAGIPAPPPHVSDRPPAWRLQVPERRAWHARVPTPRVKIVSKAVNGSNRSIDPLGGLRPPGG
jgi:hypothetical protein